MTDHENDKTAFLRELIDGIRDVEIEGYIDNWQDQDVDPGVVKRVFR